MKESSKTVLAVLCVVALALVFWLALLAPKRDKAGELSERSDALSAEVATEQAKASEAVAAKEEFPSLYRQLVLLGKAVPAEAATPSLLVQLNGVGARAKASSSTSESSVRVSPSWILRVALAASATASARRASNSSGGRKSRTTT